jgi:hypothetical protein
MKTLITVVMGVIIAVAIVTFGALIGGTIVYWLWPVAIPAILPGVVKAGWVAARLTWWQAVTTVWILGLLIKSSTSASEKKGS